jgi:hypothetical protein
MRRRKEEGGSLDLYFLGNKSFCGWGLRRHRKWPLSEDYLLIFNLSGSIWILTFDSRQLTADQPQATKTNFQHRPKFLIWYRLQQ